MYKSLSIYEVCNKHCLVLCTLLLTIFVCVIPANAQSESLVPTQTTEQALRVAHKIEDNDLIVKAPEGIQEVGLDKLSNNQRLIKLRQMAMDAAFFRNDLPQREILNLYKEQARLQNSRRDLSISVQFDLQASLFTQASNEDARKETLKAIKNYTSDSDWFVASRAYLLAASGQAVTRQFDIGLKDAQLALNLIPNKLGADYDEARYETYDFISYLQLILYNLEDGIGTTELVLETGLKSGRQIDGISLINNMAYSFENWREYETAEKLAEILFRINNKSSQGVNALVYYRYAQAQNNAENYLGALGTIDTALKNTSDPTRQIGLVSERAISLAGLGRVRGAEREFAKFDKIAIDSKIDPAGYQGKRLHAQMLIALAKGDIRTASRLQNSRSKTVIQRLLRFQNKGISGLHASLENDKQRQKERADGLAREANLARAEAAANKQRAYVLGILAMTLFALAVAGFSIAHMRKKVVHTLELAQLASEAGERAKKQFLSVMSHEFRTPLNGIIGIADLLSQYGQTQTLRNQNKIILESGEGLLELLTGILDMTYLEAGDLQVFAEPADIRKITADLYEKWQNKTEPGVVFTYGVAENVPETLMLDVKRVAQSMRNMISNAIKFTSDGRIHIHITMQNADVKPGDDLNVRGLSIIVADTGVGINDEMKSNLFKPFVQADSSMTRDYGGAGIGLAVTRGFARVMGGDVVVTSKSGYGSEFAFTLKTIDATLAAIEPDTGLPIFTCIAHEDHGITFSPGVTMEQMEERKRMRDEKQQREATADSIQDIIPSTAVPLVHERADPEREKLDKQQNDRSGFSRRESRQDELSVTPDQLEGLNILIVEDIIANQEIIRSLLEPAGCTVSAANNGRDALDLLETQIFDVVLMDIRMPILDGIDTTETIRRQAGPHQDVPIIALTADASAENNAQCLAAGADVFLTKPVIVSELFASIRFVRRKKLNSASERLSA